MTVRLLMISMSRRPALLTPNPDDDRIRRFGLNTESDRLAENCRFLKLQRISFTRDSSGEKYV